MRVTKKNSIKVLLTIWVTTFSNLVLSLFCRLFWFSKAPQQPKRICVHRVGQIGDMVCALPAMAAVRRMFKDAEFVLLTSPGQKGSSSSIELLESLSWIDRVKVYYSEDINSFRKRFFFLKELQKENFDIWIQLPQDLSTFWTEIRNIIFVKLLRIPWAGGFRVNTIKFYRREQARELVFLREDEVLSQVLRDMEIQSEFSEKAILDSAKNDPTIQKFITSLPRSKEAVMALAPGGKRVLNQWPVDRFAEIGRRWVNSGGWVVVVGGDKDWDLGQLIKAHCGQSTLNLCGQTTILETNEVLKICGILVANDSGPMHLAALIGTPCVAIFSGRDFPGKWFPRGEGHTVLKKEVDCSPCFLEECPNGHICLTNIQVDEVWSAVMNTIRGRYVSVI